MTVTVVMTTYNHQRYIEQAVESALSQETAFDYEIVIIEDCSTDRTRELVVELQRRHPDRIRLVLPDTNCNDSRNFARTIETSTSRYIACLEGDDYWTSPRKLQRQVDFLEAHPECAACFHNVLQVWDDGRWPPKNHNAPDQKRFSTIEDVLEENFIATPSLMFRQAVFPKFPEWYFRQPIGDWPLQMLSAEHGAIGYLDETMAVYRLHPNGLWNRRSRRDQLQTVINFYVDMNRNLHFKYDSAIRRQIARSWYKLAIEHESQGDVADARLALWRACTQRAGLPPLPLAPMLKMWFRLFAKSVLRRQRMVLVHDK
jgi:glycosyltransferase involved in cell wall biosynthesis